MLLQQLKLNNIRSYQEETVNFTEGSVLLSGDIGSGKSSLLLAIEFALFGTSRPDLPAEMLLRKGASNGSVELRFVLNGKTITIKRNLKKEKNSIKQLPGHVIINEIKKELMPVELKAEIINILSYPEELVNKNKNYIFRYTVYTPQEEMKFILQDNPEVRLDVLRKIFNIDKYKSIRENVQLYLKKMRTKIAVCKTKIEPLEEEKAQLKLLVEESRSLNQFLKEIKPKLEGLQERVKEQKEKVDLFEKEQQLFLKLDQQYKETFVLVKEKNKQKEQLKEKLEQIKLKEAELILPEGIRKELVEAEIKSTEVQKSEILERRSSLQEKVALLQEKIKEGQKETNLCQEQISLIGEKEEIYKKLKEEVSKRNELEEKGKQLQELFERTLGLISKNETILSQVREAQQNVTTLDNCPTCLQKVPPEHKHKVGQQQEQEIRKAEEILFQLNKKRIEISEQKEVTKKKIEDVVQKENLLTRIKVELQQLQEKGEQLQVKQEQLKLWVKQNNQLMEEVTILQRDDVLTKLEQQIKEKREQLQLLTQKEYLEEQSKEVKEQLEKIEQDSKKSKEVLFDLENELKQKKDLREKIETEKEVLTKLRQEEKEVSIEEAQLKTKIENVLEQKEKSEKGLAKLVEIENKLIRYKELYHWLEGYFLKLTYTIEKQVMLNIHGLFNQLFQEWFSILIDDENMYTRIDDAFSPVIEQNGYEIGFANLSGGEKTSAALAYRLALNKVINDVIHSIKTKDLLILDEPTDGFSSEQLDKVRDVLDKLGLKQTIIVSHESKIESFVENVIRIGKEGHVSCVS